MSRSEKSPQESASTASDTTSSDRRTSFLGALGAGAVITTLQAGTGEVIPPWICLALWGGVVWAALYGLGGWALGGIVRRVSQGAAIALALVLWVTTSPHAQVRVVETKLPETQLADERNEVARRYLGVMMTVKNHSQKRAGWAIRLTSGAVVPGRAISDHRLRRELERKILDIFAATKWSAGEEPWSQIDIDETKSFPVSIAVTPEERKDFYEGRAALLVAVKLRYRDWGIGGDWALRPWLEGTFLHGFDRCLFINNKGAILDCHSGNASW